MGIINHHDIDNGGVTFHPSEFSVEFNSDYVPDPYTTTTKSIDDDKMDHIP